MNGNGSDEIDENGENGENDGSDGNDGIVESVIEVVNTRVK